MIDLQCNPVDMCSSNTFSKLNEQVTIGKHANNQIIKSQNRVNLEITIAAIKGIFKDKHA